MKILITGNMGYVGPSVVRRLRRAYPAALLLGLDAGYFAHCLTNAQALPETDLDAQYFADVRRCPPEILNGVDAVVHLAAISNDPIGNTYEDVTFDVNHRASIDLAKLAKRSGVKSFVFASSCSMYGLADDTPRTEASSLNPLTAYAKSKVRTEAELRELASDDFTVTSLRFATACGMSERLRLDLVVNDFVACAVTSRNITILSDGTPWRPLIHVSDMARAIEWAVQRTPDGGGDFLAVNAGRDEGNYQVRELADAVARVVPGVTISVNPDAQPDNRSYRVDFSLYRSLAPQHQPEVNLHATVVELQAGLHAMGFADPDFRSSKYMRLHALRMLREHDLLDDKLQWVSRTAAGV